MVKANGKVYFLPARRMRGEGTSLGLRGIFSVRNLWEASVRPLMEGVVVSRSTNTCAVPVATISGPTQAHLAWASGYP
jgi:hypothetical protein